MWRQAIISTKDDPVNLCIYVALSLDVLRFSTKRPGNNATITILPGFYKEKMPYLGVSVT